MIYLFFAIGLLLIIKGGDWFVDGAAWIAEVTGIPKFIIGATIVSLATTLPEIMVSTIAAIEGHSILVSGAANCLIESQEKVGMAIGNGIGSVICNTALIMSISIIFMPMKVNKKEFASKAYILIAAVVALWVLTLSGSLTTLGAAFLIVIFALFIAANLKSAKEEKDQDGNEKIEADKKEIIKHVMLIVVGALCIVLGSRLLVDYGSQMARTWGISEAIIGVTMVAIGTSLPEFITAVSAVVKKQPSMSVGNVIGANIIDTTLILSIGSFIYGGNLPVSAQNIYLDFPVAILVSVIALVPTIINKKFSKIQGILMLTIYIAYIFIVSTSLDSYLLLFK